MAKELTVTKENIPIYKIIIENSYDQLPSALQSFDTHKKKICIVTDGIVGSIYESQVKEILTKIAKKVVTFTFPAGEKQKSLDTVKGLYEFLILNKFDRKDIIVALGGGVVGDLAGYTAATYLRGIDFIQLPTSLLAQVDSSIGGKTGVDFDQYKNMVGAFHQPQLVYMNLDTLNTLNSREYYSGLGEILKHGLIKDENYYVWLLEHMVEIYDKDLEVLEEMIFKSCQIKKAVVEADPEEKGERALLNFGHTIGHAIEKLMNFELLHGECIAIGCVAAAHISWKKGYIEEDEFLEIRDMFVGFHLPITISGISIDQIMETMKSDKKMECGELKFILLQEVGNAIIDKTVSEEELRNGISYIYYEEDENQGVFNHEE